METKFEIWGVIFFKVMIFKEVFKILLLLVKDWLRSIHLNNMIERAKVQIFESEESSE